MFTHPTPWNALPLLDNSVSSTTTSRNMLRCTTFSAAPLRPTCVSPHQVVQILHVLFPITILNKPIEERSPVFVFIICVLLCPSPSGDPPRARFTPVPPSSDTSRLASTFGPPPRARHPKMNFTHVDRRSSVEFPSRPCLGACLCHSPCLCSHLSFSVL